MLDFVTSYFQGFFATGYAIFNEFSIEHSTIITNAGLLLMIVSIFTKHDKSKLFFAAALLFIGFNHSFNPEYRNVLTSITFNFGIMLLIMWGIGYLIQQKIEKEPEEKSENQDKK